MAKLVILGISLLTSFILASRLVLVAKLVKLGILSSILFILALYTSFLTASFFTTLLSLLKSTGIVSNFPLFNLSTLFFKLFKLLGKFFNSSISNLPASYFKLDKLVVLAKDDVPTPVAFFINLFSLHDETNLIQFLHLLLKNLVLKNIHSFILCLFYLSSC